MLKINQVKENDSRQCPLYKQSTGSFALNNRIPVASARVPVILSRLRKHGGVTMNRVRSAIIFVLAILFVGGLLGTACGEQVLTKCHITCRCLQNDSVGNFAFVIPIDRSPDMGFDADQACKAYGHKVCLDGCNSRKFSYTYKVTSP